MSEWLNPTDGTTRDWASLQVVFGRGEEYFASDKNGKLEFKEPDIKKLTEEEEKERADKQVLRRSRTVSFLRPLSQASIRSDSAVAETPVLNRRTSSISSQRASRPPSLSYSTTGSEISTASSGASQPQGSSTATSSSSMPRFASANPVRTISTIAAPAPVGGLVYVEPASMAATASLDTIPSTNDPALSSIPSLSSNKETNSSSITSIPEERGKPNPTTKSIRPEICTCGYHDPSPPLIGQPAYANASTQTDPASSPRTALRVDTTSASSWGSNSYSSVGRDVQTETYESGFSAIPFSMGRMTNYFRKPGYQLGDSLTSGYDHFEQPMYYYQDEFGDEALR